MPSAEILPSQFVGSKDLRFKPPDALLQNHEFVMVGYRGVDGSSVLDCPEYNSALRISNPLSTPSLTKMKAAMEQCTSRLRNAGIDLGAYTILDVIGDLEAARAGLGYERVNLLSESYGTRVAQIYARVHLDRVHRSAMIGVDPLYHWIEPSDDTHHVREFYPSIWRIPAQY